MSFYIFLIIILLFLLAHYKVGGINKPKSLEYFAFFILALVLAIRFDIGADYSQYYQVFETTLARNEILKYEPLNGLLFFLLSPLNSPELIIATYAGITISILFFAIRENTTNLFLGVFTYVGLFYLSAFSTMRQGLAIVIILYSYKYLKSQRYRLFYFYVIIAGLFHYSAFIGIFFPLLYKIKPIHMFFAMLICALLFELGTNVLEKIPYVNKYASYLQMTNNFGGGNFQKIFMWCIIAFLWFFKSKTYNSNTKALVLASFGCIFPMILGSHLGGRLAQYFYIFLCIAAPNILSHNKLIVKEIYISILAIWFLGYVQIATDGNSKAFIPYQTIFEINSSNFNFKQ